MNATCMLLLALMVPLPFSDYPQEHESGNEVKSIPAYKCEWRIEEETMPDNCNDFTFYKPTALEKYLQLNTEKANCVFIPLKKDGC